MSSSSFSWQTLRAIIGGESALDIPRLDLSSRAEAVDFLGAYGFDWSDPEHREEIEQIRADALAFLQHELMPEGRLIPLWLREQRDVPALLLSASEGEGDAQRWCCALLRVMHIRAHAYSHLQSRYGPDIRRQILDRFRPHLREELQDGQRLQRLGDGEQAVALEQFEMKPEKTLHSVMLKLLQKAENVAADVFDHIGVRFVTRSRYDALRVVYYLRANNVVMFANIKPTRSRNTLVDIDRLEAAMSQLEALPLAERRAALSKLTQQLTPPAGGREYNPFTDDTYRSIQFTSRQMIRIPGQRGLVARFFFPFEVQILDRESYAAARDGRASHRVYKARQRESARRRVLGTLLEDAATEEVLRRTIAG